MKELSKKKQINKSNESVIPNHLNTVGAKKSINKKPISIEMTNMSRFKKPEENSVFSKNKANNISKKHGLFSPKHTNYLRRWYNTLNLTSNAGKKLTSSRRTRKNMKNRK